MKPGDSLLDLERRIIIESTLGTEPNAVIGLVQPGTSAVDKLKFRVEWTNLVPVSFLTKELNNVNSQYIAQAPQGEAIYSPWPESTLDVQPPGGKNPPFPHPPRPSPVVFTTTKVPTAKTFLLQAWGDMGSYYWLSENLRVLVYVNGKYQETFACPHGPSLIAICRYTYSCVTDTCTFTPAP